MPSTHTCPFCRMPAVKLVCCTSCKKVVYCSKKCQEQAWPLHIFDCQPGQPINTAYRLYKSCLRDKIPDDEETRRDYGFAKAARTMGRLSENMLCGLYRELFVALEVPPKVVHKWRRKGRLVQGIIEAFEAIPREKRGAYYVWFLEHHSVLEGDVPEDELLVERISGAIRSAWIKTGGSPRDSLDVIHTKILDLSPPRRACHILYRLFEIDGRPCPDDVEWIDFGFVAALNDAEERDLSAAYGALIKVCTFEQFCAAHESSSMPALFARYGLQCTDHFRDVMERSPYMRKSAWALKHYVDKLNAGASADQAALLPVLPAAADYGYVNCRNEADIKLLDCAYKRYFSDSRMDPITLHQACIEGQLRQYLPPFARGSNSQGKAYHRLLKTAYPLPPSAVYAGMSFNGAAFAWHIGSDNTWSNPFALGRLWEFKVVTCVFCALALGAIVLLRT